MFIQGYNAQRNNYMKALKDSTGLPRKKSFHPLGSPTKAQEVSINTMLQVHRQHPRKCLLLKAPNKFLSLDRARKLELTLFHKDIRGFQEK